MTQLRHYDHDGRARFVTFSTYQRLPVLSTPRAGDIVTASIFEISRKNDLRLLAYVVMPEHVHLVVVPPITARIGPIIGELKLGSSIRIHEILQQQRSPLLGRLQVVRDGRSTFCMWKPRCYDHNCRTDSAVWEKVNYCHNNPVKRGLAATPADWPWSSHSYYCSADNTLLQIDVQRQD
jgi:putative transposase